MNVSLTAKFRLFVFGLFIFPSFIAPQNASANSVFGESELLSNGFLSAASVDADEQEIFDLINRERERRGLSALNWNSGLARLARSYSQKMARENFFSHYDRSGASVDARARAMQITGWSKIGENLFYCEGYGDPNSMAVRGWMKSASHRENILDRVYTETGIGIAESRDGRLYVTQVFIKR